MSNDQYDAVCHARFDKIDATLDRMEKKLFLGNGSRPWSIRLDRLEQLAKVVKWVGGITGIIIIGDIVRRIWMLIAK